MSKIPFFFHAPTPRFFRDKGFFNNPKNKAFVDWCFERCCYEERTIYYKNQKIILKPYQFIFGRNVCSVETGLTEDEVRAQQERWEKLQFLKKAPNKTPNKFTVYEWVLTAFLEDSPQQNPQQTPNKPPTNPHNQEEIKKRYKKNHPSIPSFDLIDDFSSDLEKESESENETTEIYPGVVLTKEELETCIKIKGSLESVEKAVSFIMTSEKRKYPITDWPSALAKWSIPNVVPENIEKNISYAERLCNEFGEFNKGRRWRCSMYTDKQKDQRGVLFEYESPYLENVFVALVETGFKTRCYKTMTEKEELRKKTGT